MLTLMTLMTGALAVSLARMQRKAVRAGARR